jgi:hypothetical protein
MADAITSASTSSDRLSLLSVAVRRVDSTMAARASSTPALSRSFMSLGLPWHMVAPPSDRMLADRASMPFIDFSVGRSSIRHRITMGRCREEALVDPPPARLAGTARLSAAKVAACRDSCSGMPGT